MNYNIATYIIYIVATLYIIYFLGKYFHHHGRVFILHLFKGNVAVTDSTNNLLLVLYYLLNMGYAVLQLSFWDKVMDIGGMLSSLLAKLAIILLILSVIHYTNMAVLYLLSTKKFFTKFFTS